MADPSSSSSSTREAGVPAEEEDGAHKRLSRSPPLQILEFSVFLDQLVNRLAGRRAWDEEYMGLRDKEQLPILIAAMDRVRRAQSCFWKLSDSSGKGTYGEGGDEALLLLFC